MAIKKDVLLNVFLTSFIGGVALVYSIYQAGFEYFFLYENEVINSILSSEATNWLVAIGSSLSVAVASNFFRLQKQKSKEE